MFTSDSLSHVRAIITGIQNPKLLTLKISDAEFAETLENLQHFTQLIPG
jgi:hypothetical protein